MSQTTHCLALDLGAESGRAMLGTLDGNRIALEEIHRFPNGPVRLPDGIHWDVLRLWSEIKAGLALSVKKTSGSLASLGLDTWGVDFALLDSAGALLGNPFHYRDSRNEGTMAELFRRMPREQIFEYTGIQFMPINTLNQLISMVVRASPQLQAAQTFLTVPDLFNYWLSGRMVCERTNATTTQCFDPRRNAWAAPLIEAMGIPTRIFPEVIPPGTVLGGLLPDTAEETGAGGIPVIAPACHDTGSAVAAVPASNTDFAWISSGTWSIMGAEVPNPVISPQALDFNLTNEGGVAGTWRLSKNIAGMWLVQQCRHTWSRQGLELSYDELTRQAAAARPFLAVIDPDAPEFLPHGDMPARIRQYCARSGQAVPERPGEVVRVALEGLALRYRWLLERLDLVLGRQLEPIHIFGGGSRNGLLNQFTADATRRTVIAGPVEATAMGNVLMQLVALGRLGSIAEGRELVRGSFTPQVFEPGPSAAWENAYRYLCEEILKNA